jgi:glycerol kinase
MAYVLALDQGTTSSRAILFDDAGAIAARATLDPEYGKKVMQTFAPDGKTLIAQPHVRGDNLWTLEDIKRAGCVFPNPLDKF